MPNLRRRLWDGPCSRYANQSKRRDGTWRWRVSKFLWAGILCLVSPDVQAEVRIPAVAGNGAKLNDSDIISAMKFLFPSFSEAVLPGHLYSSAALHVV